MNLRVIERGDHRAKDGTKFFTITQWKRMLTEKGLLKTTAQPNIYEIRDPHGATHLLNLAQWAGRNPNKTFISISFDWRDPAKVGTSYQR